MNGLRHTLRSRLRPRRPAMSEMPGLWPSPVSFYEQARTRIRLNADGWEVQSRHPGHPFIAWELAVRHEAALLEAAFHYTRICDLPTEEEYSARTARIATLLAHAEHLSEMEQAIRPILPADSDSIRSLAFSPYPQPVPPPQSRLLPLADKHLTRLRPLLDEALDARRRGDSYQHHVFPLLIEADRQIPGAGIHSAVQTAQHGYRFPFDKDFEAVLRPLRYIPDYLGIACTNDLFFRCSVEMAGAHLEGCVKRAAQAHGVPERRLRIPLGTLLGTRFVTDLLDADDIADMKAFTRLALNPAKHNFTNDQHQGPVFIYEDAVYAYFLARHLGSVALQPSGSLDSLIAAVSDSARHDRYFWGAVPSSNIYAAEMAGSNNITPDAAAEPGTTRTTSAAESAQSDQQPLPAKGGHD